GEKPVCCVQVMDQMLGLDEQILCLLPCESVTYVLEYMVPEDWCMCEDGEWLNNTVTARGWCCDNWVEESTMKSILIINEADIRVWKTASVGEANVGDTIEFTITVANCGSMSFGCVKVTDELLGIYELDIGCLAPCQVWSATYRYTIPEDYTMCEDRWLNNTVYACSYMMDVFVEDEDTASVLVLAPCKLKIEKSVITRSGNDWVYPGEQVKFVYNITNIGICSLIVKHVYDPTTGYEIWPNGTLAPGAWHVLTTDPFTIPDDPICEEYYFVNTVFVEACCCCYEPCCWLEVSDTHELLVRSPCEISVVKKAPEVAMPGETIEYSIVSAT
ncbi:MAG: DUF11 domain-containing protein, partial [Methanomassiliicoccales archaeon]|nr:DUF11 domain-containing protein [Methanomassiliicoccales archaeon]